jgi:hypothetical protein
MPGLWSPCSSHELGAIKNMPDINNLGCALPKTVVNVLESADVWICQHITINSRKMSRVHPSNNPETPMLFNLCQDPGAGTAEA